MTNEVPAYELDDGPLTEEQIKKIKELSGVPQNSTNPEAPCNLQDAECNQRWIQAFGDCC